jgi:hypothetical protein
MRAHAVMAGAFLSKTKDQVTEIASSDARVFCEAIECFAEMENTAAALVDVFRNTGTRLMIAAGIIARSEPMLDEAESRAPAAGAA